MRNPRRDRLEYLLYSTVMTSVTVALGLALVFGFDEHGRVRKPVLDQPLDESWREAKMEMREYAHKKEHQLHTWIHRRGYGDAYERWQNKWLQKRTFGANDSASGRSSINENLNNATTATVNSSETKKVQDWMPPTRDYASGKPQQPRWWA